MLALALVAPGAASGQDYTLGATGWQVERVANRFVVMRAEIHDTAGKQERQGLLILTCDPQARRIRFQISRAPGQPSLESNQIGRAMIRGRGADDRILAPFHARVRFFPDGSMELLEAVGFTDPTMRQFLNLLEALPAFIEVVLFRGPESGAFVRGEALRFRLEQLEANLVGLYGFEGLCYRRMKAAHPEPERPAAQSLRTPRRSHTPLPRPDAPRVPQAGVS